MPKLKMTEFDPKRSLGSARYPNQERESPFCNRAHVALQSLTGQSGALITRLSLNHLPPEISMRLRR